MKALLLEKDDAGLHAAVQDVAEDRLPEGEVLVRVLHSTLNYKDGLVLAGKGGLVRTYPHVPGVDFSGIVETSSDPRWEPGDEVILTGWRFG